MRRMAQTSLITYSESINQEEFKNTREHILFLLKYKYPNGATLNDLARDLQKGKNCFSGRLTELVKSEDVEIIWTRKETNRDGTRSTMNVYEAR